MKRKLALFFGGKSPEHEISIRSAKSLFEAFDRSLYTVRCFYINPEGKWFALPEETFPEPIKEYYSASEMKAQSVSILPGSKSPFQMESHALEVDFVFSILHGQNGEDGSFQGLMQLLDLPFAGCDILSSAICMDKVAMKPVLDHENINNARYVALSTGQSDYQQQFEQIESGNLGFPVFVKPARLGSSVGVSKVSEPSELLKAVELAFQYDSSVLVEEMIKGREVECAVLGNEKPRASAIGEIVADNAIYSFESKYNNPDAAKLVMPAEIDESIAHKLKDFAIHCYRALNCEGFARVDMFLTEDGQIYLNEINTLPGFTAISMYPALWKISGLDTTALLNEIIKLGNLRQQRKHSLKTTRA